MIDCQSSGDIVSESSCTRVSSKMSPAGMGVTGSTALAPVGHHGAAARASDTAVARALAAVIGTTPDPDRDADQDRPPHHPPTYVHPVPPRESQQQNWCPVDRRGAATSASRFRKQGRAQLAAR